MLSFLVTFFFARAKKVAPPQEEWKLCFKIKTKKELDSSLRWNDELGGAWLPRSGFRGSATALGSGFRTRIQVHRQYRIAMHATQAQATRFALTADEADHIFNIDVKQALAAFGTFAMVDHLRLPVGRIT